VIFAAVQPTDGHRAGGGSGIAGGQAQIFVDPLGHAQPVLLTKFRIERRHGAVAQLRGDIAPEAAVGVDVLGCGGPQEVDPKLGIARVVAAYAILGEDGPDGLREFVLGGLLR
jgi:hypothetical protein